MEQHFAIDIGGHILGLTPTGKATVRLLDMNGIPQLAAVTDAAKRGVSVRDCTMYVTTFPCHNCARHIVASGIRRVFYVEPYPKSLASMLHLDAIATDGVPKKRHQVAFMPFVGVAPRQYMRLFAMPNRKTDDGHTRGLEERNSGTTTGRHRLHVSRTRA